VSDLRKGYAFKNPDIAANSGWGAILTPDELRYVYAFGQGLTAPNAQVITDDTLQWYIDNAVGSVETDLRIKLIKRIYKARPSVHNVARTDADFTSGSEATIIGTVDISRSINLSTNFNLKIAVDKGTYITVDCKGATPAATTLAEIIAKINTALGATIATAYDNKYLKLTSTTEGETSYIELEAPSGNDATLIIMGLTIDSGYKYEYRGWVEGLDFEWDEGYDFDRKQFAEFMWIKLRNRPVISLEKVEWKDVAGNLMADITKWAKVNYEKGSIQFFPSAGSLQTLPVYLGQTFSISKFLATVEHYPDAYFVDYTAGLASAEHVRKKWPELFTVAGKLAAINLLAAFGDGRSAAIGSSSIGLSGISESYSTTMSATSIGAETKIPVLFAKRKSSPSIEWMFRNKKYYIGGKVLAVNPKTGKPAYKKILDVVEHDTRNRQCYEITFDNNYKLSITEDHSLFIKNGIGIKKIKGKDIFLDTILVGADEKRIHNLKIKDIIKIKRDKMYDLSIEDYENFVDIGKVVIKNSSMFGARIIQYKDELKTWYKMNRSKYGGVQLGSL